jgi:hypothetical protein
VVAGDEPHLRSCEIVFVEEPSQDREVVARKRQLLQPGGYVEGEGDILAAYMAKVLSVNYDTDLTWEMGASSFILPLSSTRPWPAS